VDNGGRLATLLYTKVDAGGHGHVDRPLLNRHISPSQIMDPKEFLSARAPKRQRKLLPYTYVIREMREHLLATYEEIRLYLEIEHSVKVARTAIQKHCAKHGIILGGAQHASQPAMTAGAMKEQNAGGATKTPAQTPSFTAQPLSSATYDKAMPSEKPNGAKREDESATTGAPPAVDPRRSAWDRPPRAPTAAALLRRQNLKG
jgi:hypothetical protein